MPTRLLPACHPASRPVLQDFFQHHVHESTYVLQVFKRPGCTCQACAAGLLQPLRMPEEEFKNVHLLPLPLLVPQRPGDRWEAHCFAVLCSVGSGWSENMNTGAKNRAYALCLWDACPPNDQQGQYSTNPPRNHLTHKPCVQ